MMVWRIPQGTHAKITARRIPALPVSTATQRSLSPSAARTPASGSICACAVRGFLACQWIEAGLASVPIAGGCAGIGGSAGEYGMWKMYFVSIHINTNCYDTNNYGTSRRHV